MNRAHTRLLAAVLALGLALASAAAETKPKYDDSLFSGLELRGIGPALTSGRIVDIAVDPRDPRTWYVATACGRRLEDHQRRHHLHADLRRRRARTPSAASPSTRTTRWSSGSARARTTASAASRYGDGVYKSIDGGKTLEERRAEKSEHIGKIVVDPARLERRLRRGAGPALGAGRRPRPLQDHRRRQDLEGRPDHQREHRRHRRRPRSRATPTSSTPPPTSAAATSARSSTAAPSRRIHKSTDGGATWTKLSNGLPKERHGPHRPGHLAAAARTPSTPSSRPTRKAGGFFRSTDGGANWEKRNSYVAGSPQYYQELFADPEQRRPRLRGGRLRPGHRRRRQDLPPPGREEQARRQPRRLDRSREQRPPAGRLRRRPLRDLRPRRELATSSANLPITQFYRVSADNALPFYNVYGGTQDNFSLGGPSRTDQPRTASRNADWYVTQGGDGFQLRRRSRGPEHRLRRIAVRRPGPLRQAHRRGARHPAAADRRAWTRCAWNWDSPLIISPHAHNRLYFARAVPLPQRRPRQHLEADQPRSHPPDRPQQAAGHGPGLGHRRRGQERLDLVLRQHRLARRVAAEGGAALRRHRRRPDPGHRGRRRATGARSRSFAGVPEMHLRLRLERVAARRRTPSTPRSTTTRPATSSPTCCKSTDRGRTWTSIAGDLPARGTVYALARTTSIANLLFAGTEFGLYFTQNGGGTWIQLKGGLPTIAVRDLWIQKRRDDLVVATFGRGFYILDDYRRCAR